MSFEILRTAVGYAYVTGTKTILTHRFRIDFLSSTIIITHTLAETDARCTKTQTRATAYHGHTHTHTTGTNTHEHAHNNTYN